MLDLITHEIPCPDDRAMRKFLWHSAFHDADLLAIRYDEETRSDVTLRIGHHIRNDIRHGVYLLRFHGVKHVEYASASSGHDRLYATIFLDSAALHQKQTECEKPLYHLRLQTWCGYIDLIFERFTIRLEAGRVDYRPRNIDDRIIANNRDRHYRQTHMELAAALSSSRPYDMDTAEYHAPALYDEDVDEYHACGLYIVSQDGKPQEIASRAREVLKLPLVLFHARTHAAYLLGHYGTAEDVPQLTALLLTLPADLPAKRRIVLDAMERLTQRIE